MRSFSLAEHEITNLAFLYEDIKEIEDLISKGDQEKLLGISPSTKKSESSKAVILRIIQEHLAAGEELKVNSKAKSNMKTVLSNLQKFIEDETSY